MSNTSEVATIRSMTDADYETVATVSRAAVPQWDVTADWLRGEDQRREVKYRPTRLIAELGGEGPVGYAFAGTIPECYDPRKLMVGVYVLPDKQRQGIGSALYDRIVQEIMLDVQPVSLTGKVSEDDEAAARFAEKRGYMEIMREWPSILSLEDLELADFTDRLSGLDRYGVAIRSYTELADDPKRDRKLYDLEMAIWADMPSVGEFTPVSYEQYRAWTLDRPTFLPGGCFVLVHGTRYLGLTNLFRRDTEGDLYVNATGVLRSARRRGLAFALKVRAAMYAKEAGYKRIYTDNVSTNRPMLSINECLGFKRRTAYIFMTKTLAGGQGG